MDDPQSTPREIGQEGLSTRTAGYPKSRTVWSGLGTTGAKGVHRVLLAEVDSAKAFGWKRYPFSHLPFRPLGLPLSTLYG